ncbi:MAG: hypothetical protein AAGH74_01275 [Pseudomonadota bacterium]
MLTLRQLKSRLSGATRFLLTGSNLRTSQDEQVGEVLVELTPEHDPELTEPRLNVLTPSLSASQAFGGLWTHLEIAMQVYAKVLRSQGWRLRFISINVGDVDDDNLAEKLAAQNDVPKGEVAYHYLGAEGHPIPIGAKDVFVGSLWHNYYAALPLLRFQERMFGAPRLPYLSLVQDYEPGFYPWSSAYVMARAAYDSDWPKCVVFNSYELRDFFTAQGHPVEQSVAFQPVMNSTLLTHLNAGTDVKKEKQILFYGRPGSPRNCFYIGRRALQIWSQTYPKARDWSVRSVGIRHAALDLAPGVSSEVLGKLTLDQYAAELAKSAVGLSLMASPHPSYPPLEMAHFGALTVTNSFEFKDLTNWHENLISVQDPNPATVAEALIEACERADENGTHGGREGSKKPSYLAGYDPAVIDQIGQMILSSMTRP